MAVVFSKARSLAPAGLASLAGPLRDARRRAVPRRGARCLSVCRVAGPAWAPDRRAGMVPSARRAMGGTALQGRARENRRAT